MPTTVLADTLDLLVMKEDFPAGSVEDEFGPSFFVLLRNFGLNGNKLANEHIDVLRNRVVPFVLRRPGFAEIYALTDRSGSRQVNYKVSAERLHAVQRQMLQLGAPNGSVNHRFAKAIGEDFFEARLEADQANPSNRDGLKDGQRRSVVIGLSPAPIGIPTRRFRVDFVAEILAFGRKHQQKPGN